MLDSLGGKQISPWFDSLSSTMNSNSSVSSGSPPNFSQFGNSELQRPSWLFNSQVPFFTLSASVSRSFGWQAVARMHLHMLCVCLLSMGGLVGEGALLSKNGVPN
ncbi:hypothetical protein Q1695_003800 [Nippostrongylus brasiliensis]|nr:hypothetical protein Q1695_003800 [Nippostrongylus brasiliensis]